MDGLMVSALCSDRQWSLIQDECLRLHKELGVHENEARCILTHRLGRKPGTRIVVTRLSDGLNISSFVICGR